MRTQHFDRKFTLNATSFGLAVETVLLGVFACLAVQRFQTVRNPALLTGLFQSVQVGVLLAEHRQSLSQSGIVGVDACFVLAFIEQDDGFFLILRQLRIKVAFHLGTECLEEAGIPLVRIVRGHLDCQIEEQLLGLMVGSKGSNHVQTVNGCFVVGAAKSIQNFLFKLMLLQLHFKIFIEHIIMPSLNSI